MDLPAAYVAMTESLLRTLSLSHQLGHLNGGLIIYFGVHFLLGQRRGSVFPLLAVFLAEFANETVQAVYYGGWRPADTLADIGWTVFWPCMIFAFGRARTSRKGQIFRLLPARV